MCQCDVKKCKASCCYNVPMEKGYITAFIKKVVNPIIRIEYYGEKSPNGREICHPITSDKQSENKCPFLRADYKCNIYDKRPWICRKWGEGKGTKLLKCGWQNGEECDTMVHNQYDNDIMLAEMATLIAQNKL